MANDGEPLLPQELLDSIVDKLRPIDDSASHQALQSCALVCNSFRLRAHRALFFRVNLVPETLAELQDADSIWKQRKRTQELYRLLKANPYLISCIRSLKINIDRRAKVTGPLGYLAEVLDILYESTSESQGLVELIVRSGTPSSVPALWPNISAPTQKSLLNLIHGPKTQLKRLILGNFKKLPLTMFVRCQILKSLILEWVEIDDSPEDNTSNRTVQDDLWSLGELVWTGSWSLNKFFQGLATMLSIKTLASKLRRLCVSGPVPVQDGMMLRKILEWSADSLRSLILYVIEHQVFHLLLTLLGVEMYDLPLSMNHPNSQEPWISHHVEYFSCSSSAAISATLHWRGCH